MISLSILAEDPFLIHADNIARIPDAYEVTVVPEARSMDERALLDAYRSTEVAVLGRKSPPLPDALIQDPGLLKWVAYCFGSIRHYVTKAHIAAGLQVTNWGDAPRPVAEGAMALLLCLVKQIPGLDRYCKQGADGRIWQDYYPSLARMRVGIYGYGPIGRQVGQMLDAFGADVWIYDPYATDVPGHFHLCDSLDELFATCHAVTVQCGLNDQTRGSVTRERLERMCQGGIVVNTARGPIVDEDALAELVGAGRLLAGCDVICDEGAWDASPLATHDNALLTRHRVGPGKGYAPDRKPLKPLPEFLLDNLSRYAAGLPLKHLITADEYDLKT